MACHLEQNGKCSEISSDPPPPFPKLKLRVQIVAGDEKKFFILRVER